MRHLSVMLSLCLKYDIVPISFTKGVLVPLLKKTTMDPSVPNNYRPVTVSSTLSKLLEVYVLEVCGHHDFNDLQFGFISGRGTNMAVSMMLYLTVQSVGLLFIHVHWTHRAQGHSIPSHTLFYSERRCRCYSLSMECCYKTSFNVWD